MSRRCYAVELWNWDTEFLRRIATYRTRRRAAHRARQEQRDCQLNGPCHCLWVVVRI